MIYLLSPKIGAVIDPTNSFLYVSAYLRSLVYSAVLICPINPVNGSLGACTMYPEHSAQPNPTFNFNDDVATNMFIQNINGVNYLYAPNGGTTIPPSPFSVTICPLQANGLILDGTCNVNSDPTFSEPDGISIAPQP